MKPLQIFLLLTLCVFTSTQVLAHNSHIASGFIAGLAHPFSGADHLVTLLLAGVLISRLFTGQIKTAITTLSLLLSVYIWSHGAAMSEMNSLFMFGFLLTSAGIVTLAILADKLIRSSISKHLKNHA